MSSFLFTMFSKLGAMKNISLEKVKVAKNWFRDQAKRLTKVNANEFMKSNPEAIQKNTHFDAQSVGKMYMFYYDPKTKKDLPYYDRYPLVFPIKLVKGGFLGLNMHYLPPMLRAKLMDALYLLDNKAVGDKRKLKMTYDILQSASKFKYFKPCLKMYLYSHVRSKFVNVPQEEWDMVLMLPLERFEKASKQHVWKESAEKIGAKY